MEEEVFLNQETGVLITVIYIECYQTKVEGEDNHLTIWPPADSNKATTNHSGYIISWGGNIKYQGKVIHTKTEQQAEEKTCLCLLMYSKSSKT